MKFLIVLGGVFISLMGLPRALATQRDCEELQSAYINTQNMLFDKNLAVAVAYSDVFMNRADILQMDHQLQQAQANNTPIDAGHLPDLIKEREVYARELDIELIKAQIRVRQVQQQEAWLALQIRLDCESDSFL